MFLTGLCGTVEPLAQLQKCVWALLLSKQVWKHFHFHFHPVAGDCQEVREPQGSLQESPVNTYRCPGQAESSMQLVLFEGCILGAVSMSHSLASSQMPVWHIPQCWWSRHQPCAAISSLTLWQSSSSLREAVLINLVTCAHKSSGFLNNSPSASPTSWIITIWWSNFCKVQRCQNFFGKVLIKLKKASPQTTDSFTPQAWSIHRHYPSCALEESGVLWGKKHHSI